MVASGEYLRVLAIAARCITKQMHDRRLPDLTPEQVVRWLHSVTVENLETAMALPEEVRQAENPDADCTIAA